MLRLVSEATRVLVFVVPCSPPRTRVLNFGTKMSVQPHGAWKPPRSTNLPSRFHESNSSSVPFGICMLVLLVDVERDAFIAGR